MTKRLTGEQARAKADHYGFELDKDFHALSVDQVQRVLDAADAHGYRAPKNANGSRARYFHAYLRRVARA